MVSFRMAKRGTSQRKPAIKVKYNKPIVAPFQRSFLMARYIIPRFKKSKDPLAQDGISVLKAIIINAINSADKEMPFTIFILSAELQWFNSTVPKETFCVVPTVFLASPKVRK